MMVSHTHTSLYMNYSQWHSQKQSFNNMSCSWTFPWHHTDSNHDDRWSVFWTPHRITTRSPWLLQHHKQVEWVTKGEQRWHAGGGREPASRPLTWALERNRSAALVFVSPHRRAVRARAGRHTRVSERGSHRRHADAQRGSSGGGTELRAAGGRVLNRGGEGGGEGGLLQQDQLGDVTALSPSRHVTTHSPHQINSLYKYNKKSSRRRKEVCFMHINGFCSNSRI